MLRLAQRTLDSTFRNLGQQVTVRRKFGGPVLSVLALPAGEPVEGGFRFSQTSRRDSLTFKVRVSEWRQPEKGDNCDILGEIRQVTDVEHDDDLRLVWLIDTEAAA